MHVGAETAARHGFAQQALHFGTVGFVKGDGHIVTGVVDIAGAVAFFGGGVEGELAHGEHIASHILHAAVHHAFVVVEYAHVHGFLGEPLHIGFSVAFSHAHQHHQSGADGAYHRAVNRHGGLRYTLYH